MRHVDERGATAVEYALIASLIAVVALVGIVFFGRVLAGSYEESTLAIGAAIGATSTDTSTPTSTPTSEPTASATAPPAGPLSVNVAAADGIESTPVPTPSYNSQRDRWECPEGWQVTGSGTGRRCQATGRG